jgi:cyclopropane-fatty-acyl-phospholipid synthase
MRLLSSLLSRFVVNGRLTVIDHAGRRHAFGNGRNGPDVTMRLTDRAVEREIFFNPELRAAEAYMNGRLTFEPGSTVHDFLTLFSVNRQGLGGHPVQQTLRQYWRMMKRAQQCNPVGGAAENVRHHYDIPTAFYRLWLDDSMAYSCAYFETPEATLEDAQQAKFRLIAAKLKLEPGMRVIDIGAGWGGLALWLARHCGVDVVGLNVSTEQLAFARQRAESQGLADRVRFVEAD